MASNAFTKKQRKNIGLHPKSLDDLDFYDFLVGSLIDRPILQRASLIATDWGVSLHEVVLTLNWITPEDCVTELAAILNVGDTFAETSHLEARAIDATSPRPSHVAAEVNRSKSSPSPIYLTSTLRPQIGLTQRQHKQLLSQAVNERRNEGPTASAACQTPIW